MIGMCENSGWISDELWRQREIQAAVEYGIDVSHLVENVNSSVAERIRRHQIALNTAEQLRRAKRL